MVACVKQANIYIYMLDFLGRTRQAYHANIGKNRVCYLCDDGFCAAEAEHSCKIRRCLQMLGDTDTRFALQTVTKTVTFFLKAHEQCAG